MAAPEITPYTGGVPQRTDPVNFSEYTDTWVLYQSNLPAEYNSLSLYLDNLSSDIDDTAADAEQSAINSANSAAESANSAQTSASTANFKGEWSSLSGTLNLPSSVYHKGETWQLLNNLADVTLSEPGQTADWYKLDNSARITSNRYLHFYRNR